MDWLVFVPIFILGTILGSLLNVLIYRIPEGLSIFFPRSFCPNCRNTIPFYRNIPVLTYIFQVGKRSCCDGNIPVQYPIIELISGVIWGWSFSNCHLQEALFLSLLISLLLVIAWIDYQQMIIPLNMILASGLLVIIAMGFKILPLQESIIGSLVGPISFGGVLGLTYLVSKRQGMGTGDIQLSAVLGGWQGPVNIILIFFIASILSLLSWFSISLFMGFDKNRALPFAPFLVLSSITIFFLEFYFRVNFLTLIIK